ncbi:hypothetical protein AFLA_013375 [Aspergillus flavus NRRL3357]|nr:hypothetical protein AFLA_013375 [Aspergillus flavus NRRL3357]
MADPIGVAGLALSGISLFFQVYAGTLMLVARDVPDKYQQLRLRLEIEQGRLLSWGHSFGLLQEESEEEDASRISIPEQVRYMVQGYIEPLWQKVLHFTAETPSFVPRDKREETPSVHHGGMARRFRLDRMYAKARQGTIKFKDRVNWAYWQMDKLEDLVECMRHVNGSVIALAEVKTQQEIQETVKATLMGLLSLQDTVNGLKELIVAVEEKRLDNRSSQMPLGEPNDLLLGLANLKKMRLQIGHDKNDGSLQSDLKIQPERVWPMNKMKYPSPQRQDATLDGKEGFWVEYKDYSSSDRIVGPTKDEIERHIVRELAALLISKLPSSFRVARCVGYYEEAGSFGLVFEKHAAHADQTIIPLSHCLSLETQMPSLGERIALAQGIVQTVFQLHVVGWLHKGLRPANILLFEDHNGGIAYDKSYISGFEDARPVAQPNLTEEAHSRLLNDDWYRHPDIQTVKPAHREFQYCMRYDLYSLGILLVEIALWKPVLDIQSNVGPGDIKSFILSHNTQCLQRIQFAFGRKYAEIVMNCLNPGEEMDDHTQMDSYIYYFEKLVVKPMKQMSVD